MARPRNRYIRGKKITAPAWNGLDTSASIVTEARIFCEALDDGQIEITDLADWLQLIPKDSQPAFLKALRALGINH